VLGFEFWEIQQTSVVPANNHKGCAGPVPKFSNLLSCDENSAPDKIRGDWIFRKGSQQQWIATPIIYARRTSPVLGNL